MKKDFRNNNQDILFELCEAMGAEVTGIARVGCYKVLYQRIEYVVGKNSYRILNSEGKDIKKNFLKLAMVNGMTWEEIYEIVKKTVLYTNSMEAEKYLEDAVYNYQLLNFCIKFEKISKPLLDIIQLKFGIGGERGEQEWEGRLIFGKYKNQLLASVLVDPDTRYINYLKTSISSKEFGNKYHQGMIDEMSSQGRV